jgi:catechol 2,3-dioxygenase-like lactoylglutathione lyase family enzyme
MIFTRKTNRRSLHVQDLDGALRFYRDLLGMQLRSRADRSAHLQTDQQELELLQREPSEALPQLDELPLSIRMTAWEWDEVGRRLKKHRADLILRESAPHARERALWVRDPDGHLIQVHAPAPAPVPNTIVVPDAAPAAPGWKWGWLVIALVVLVLLGSGAFYLFHSQRAEAASARIGSAPPARTPNTISEARVVVSPSGAWTGYEFTYCDGELRIARVRVNLLSDEARWKLGSTDVYEIAAGKPERMQQFLRYLEELAKVHQAEEIVCFGTASYQGERSREEERAGTRARVLGSLCRLAFPQATIHRVNLGQHKPKHSANSSDAAEQRPIVIAEIEYMDPGMNLAVGLKDALLRARSSFPRLALDIQSFSRFDFETARNAKLTSSR